MASRVTQTSQTKIGQCEEGALHQSGVRGKNVPHPSFYKSCCSRFCPILLERWGSTGEATGSRKVGFLGVWSLRLLGVRRVGLVDLCEGKALVRLGGKEWEINH